MKCSRNEGDKDYILHTKQQLRSVHGTNALCGGPQLS